MSVKVFCYLVLVLVGLTAVQSRPCMKIQVCCSGQDKLFEACQADDVSELFEAFQSCKFGECPKGCSSSPVCCGGQSYNSECEAKADGVDTNSCTIEKCTCPCKEEEYCCNGVTKTLCCTELEDSNCQKGACDPNPCSVEGFPCDQFPYYPFYR
eukprot:TRINITY_DN5090_c0_g3_i1.p2 TRINITY_DN5090_c0_g3~~TRINITY_DN5090_c0_g3_i1.p2  ORF type:complete len:154 (+),score=8.99 TRINITY_DN5090_c0_g3_i1:117-578(+)